MLRRRLLRQWLAILTVLLTLSAALGVLPAFAAQPGARHAAATGTFPDLSITSVTPAIAVPNKPVTIAGTVTAGRSPFLTPRVTAALGTANLDTANDIQQWTTGKSSIRTGKGASDTLSPLVAGATQQFSVTIPASAFPTGYRNANFPVLLSLMDGSSTAPKRTWRTTVSFVARTPSIPVPLTWLVPLTLPADAALFGRSGAARNEAWANAIGPGSRVSNLLDTLSDQPITWIIDPALTVPAAAADPTLPPVGAPRPGAAQPGSPTNTSPATEAPSPESTSSDASGASPTAPTSTSNASPSKNSPSSTGSSGPGSDAASDTTSGTPDQSSSSGTPSPPPSTSPGDTTASDPVEVLTAALRDRLRNLPTTQSVLWTAQDDPDLSALTKSGPRGSRILREEVGRTLRPDMAAISRTEVAWPVDGVNAADVRKITSAWSAVKRPAPVLVLPTDGIAGADNSTSSAQRTIAGTGGAMLYNQSLSALAGSGSSDVGFRTQQFLAQSLAIYDEGPAARRSLTIALPRVGGATAAQLSQLIQAVRAAPWLSDTTGASVVQSAPTVPRASVTSTRGKVKFPVPEQSAISSAVLAKISTQRGQLSGLNSLLVNSLDVISDRLHLVNNLGSTRWRGQLIGAAQASKYSAAALTTLLESVYVSTSPVNFFTDRGTINTIAVVNSLDRGVRGVQVLLRPRAIALKVERQPLPISLRAGGRGLVSPRLAAAGSGTVPVDVVVQTANGFQLGKPTQQKANLQVNVLPTASSWIYRVFGGAAVLILITGIVRSVRRGPRRDGGESQSRPEDGRTPDDAIVAGPTITESTDKKTTENDQDE